MTRRLLYAAFALLLSAGAASADVTYSFYVNTAGLPALAPSGGWLDFEFNQANALTSRSATAVIDNLILNGYTPGPTVQTTPGVTGTLPGPISIPNDQGAANYFTQEITSWGTSFSFDVTLSGPALGAPALDGSSFFVFLYDPGFNPIVAPPTFAGQILDLTIDPTGAVTPTVTTFDGGSSAVAPEPATVSLLLTAVGLIALKLRRR